MRHILAFLSAIGLLSLAQQLFQWQEMIGYWLDAWQAITRPVIELLFGWIVRLIGYEFPNSLKDYLAMGLITSGAATRGDVEYHKLIKRPLSKPVPICLYHL